jgi:hypothetical protein
MRLLFDMALKWPESRRQRIYSGLAAEEKTSSGRAQPNKDCYLTKNVFEFDLID